MRTVSGIVQDGSRSAVKAEKAKMARAKWLRARKAQILEELADIEKERGQASHDDREISELDVGVSFCPISPHARMPSHMLFRAGGGNTHCSPVREDGPPTAIPATL